MSHLKYIFVIALTAPVLLVGCSIVDRRIVLDAGKSEVIRTSSGDRFYFDLDERDGCRWSFRSVDPDVEVTMERSGVGKDAKVSVRIRIHRGFDGPSQVYFSCWSPNADNPKKEFAIAFFKRTGDVAFWE